MDNCPSCKRPFEKFEDFPSIYVVSLVRPPIPKFVKGWYQECMPETKTKRVGNEPLPQKVLDMFKKSGESELVRDQWIYEKDDCDEDGIQWYKRIVNLTPDVQKVLVNPQLAQYLQSLDATIGREVKTADFLPKFKRDKYFKSAFPIEQTNYGIGFREQEAIGENRLSNLVFLGEGPNMGSAGGPTLSHLFTLAEVTYQGRINH